MKKIIIPLLFAVLPLLSGVALPYVAFPGDKHFLNFFWSPIYGIALWVLDEMGMLWKQSPLPLMGVVAWPIAVSCALFVLGSKVQQGGDIRLRFISLCLLCASACCITSLENSLQWPLSKVPTFYRIFASIW